MRTPLISVIIPCYNYGDYVEEAVESVCGQTYPNKEILVVDGGSTDQNTLAILKKLADRKVRVFFRGKRFLVGNNRNFGVKRAKGAFVCCLDADDRMHPTFLEKAMFVMLAGKQDIVSTSAQLFGKERMIELVPEFPSVEQSRRHNEINTLALVKKSLWARLGGMRDWGIGEQYVYEDWDFWLRSLLSGARVRNISREPLFFYRKHHEHSLSNQSGKTKDAAKHRDAIAEANAAAIADWDRGLRSAQEVSSLPNEQLFPIRGKTTGCAVILIPTFSDLLACVSLHEKLPVGEAGRTLLLCWHEDPRGRHWVETQARLQNCLVFEFPRFLDPENYQSFIRYAIGLHGSEHLWCFDSAASRIMRASSDAMLKYGMRLAGACYSPTRLSQETFGCTTVELEVVSKVNPFSRSNRVWIAGIESEDTAMRDSVFDMFRNHPDWSLHPCFWSPEGFVFEGRPGAKQVLILPNHLRLLLLGHSHGGVLSVKRDQGNPVLMDSFSDSQRYLWVSGDAEHSPLASFTDSTHESLLKACKTATVGIELRVLEEKNPESQGFEVWLEDFRLPTGASLMDDGLGAFLKLPAAGAWNLLASADAPRGYACLGSPGGVLRLSIPEFCTLGFLKHDWSGVVEIVTPFGVHRIDLYSREREMLKWTFVIPGNRDERPNGV